MAFYVRLRLNEGAIKARVKSDTSANNWPMNAQFFFSSYVTCHATSWTRTPSGGGSRGTKDKLQRLRQITPCLSQCTDPATIASCRNMLLEVLEKFCENLCICNRILSPRQVTQNTVWFDFLQLVAATKFCWRKSKNSLVHTNRFVTATCRVAATCRLVCTDLKLQRKP